MIGKPHELTTRILFWRAGPQFFAVVAAVSWAAAILTAVENDTPYLMAVMAMNACVQTALALRARRKTEPSPRIGF